MGYEIHIRALFVNFCGAVGLPREGWRHGGQVLGQWRSTLWSGPPAIFLRRPRAGTPLRGGAAQRGRPPGGAAVRSRTSRIKWWPGELLSRPSFYI